jgi:hypothetical protein
MDGIDIRRGAELIREAKAAGLTVAANGGKLVVSGPRPLQPLALRLLQNKRHLMAALATLDQLCATPQPALLAGPVCRLHPQAGVVDVPIHRGQSMRRDCATCGRFIAFTLWYGRPSPN